MTKKTSPAYRASKEETIPINKLHPFSNHPFHIRHDLEFSELVDSISESGIITPIIVRPKVGVGYEVISGHRRWEACKELGIESIPARVEYIDDDEATILMVNSNIQREHVLPSEKAFAYKMRMEAMKHQGKATSSQLGTKLRTLDAMGKEVDESRNQIHRYIRLTYLIPSILQMVDDGRIAFNPAVEISYMTEEHYIDEGITGTQMKKRPSFMRMIEHAKEHRFDLIVTRELSRFARNTVDALNATRELKQYGVEVYFVNDGIWTMDGDGEVRLTIMASIAQDESRKTSERVKAGQKMSREKGVLYGSGNIIGYDRVDGTYVINEEQAATVRRIFNLYAEGHGETTVAKMLIEENRKDGGGGLSWTASKVSRVLRKPTYKGYMTYNKSHIDDFLSHNRINHSEEDFVLVKGNFEPIVSEALWETCNQIRSKRAAFVKGKDGRAHKFGVSFPQNKWTKILFCDCGMRFQIEGYDKTANGGKNMRLICARSKMFKKKDAARALNGIPCPAPYASEWKLELMAREVFRTVWKENAEDILGLLRMLDANLNTTGTPNDGNQLENKLSALNEELDDLVSQRASRSITMDDFLSRSTEINNEIINVEGLLQSSIQEQRPKARLDMHSIEAALSDDASFPDGKIEPGFLDRYANRIVKSNNRYIWMLQLVNVQQIMPIQSERQPIAMVTYKSGVPYDIEQEQTGKQDKESAGPDCATICRPQDFFLNMSRTKRKRKLVEWLESCQENQVNVLDEKIPLLSFAVDFVTAYEYQKARGIKIHPGLWKDMRVDIFLVKKEN